LSGLFGGTSYHRPIIAKEVFMIVATCNRFTLLLDRPDRVHIYTDRRNL
jgi:hypothetical protein